MKSACDFSEINVHAQINKCLFEWQNGKIFDMDFVKNVFHAVSKESLFLAQAIVYVFCTAIGRPLANEKLNEVLNDILDRDEFESTVLSQL